MNETYQAHLNFLQNWKFVMKYEVNKDVCDKTRCDYDYSCLLLGKCGKRDFCIANAAIYKDGLMLNEQHEPGICSYHMEYNFGEMCICPVRFAIFQKYSI